MENLDHLKHHTSGTPKYILTNANVFVSPGGFHYIDHLDPMEEVSPEIDGSALNDAEIAYIEKSLQSNPERLENQIAAVKRHNLMLISFNWGNVLFYLYNYPHKLFKLDTYVYMCILV